MTVKLLLFAQCSDIVGSRELDVDLADGSTVNDLLGKLLEAHPGLKGLERSMMISVNQTYVEREQVLSDGDEVALITPVSGG